MQSPRLYATFLLWLLSELFEDMPEIGDPERSNECQVRMPRIDAA